MPSVSIYRPPAARKLEQSASLSRDMVATTPSPEKSKLKCSEEGKEIQQSGKRGSDSNGMSVFRNAITSIRTQSKVPECKVVESSNKKIEEESKVAKPEEEMAKSAAQNRQRRPDIQVYVPKGRRSSGKPSNNESKVSEEKYKNSEVAAREEEAIPPTNPPETKDQPSKVDSESPETKPRPEISKPEVTPKDTQSKLATDTKVTDSCADSSDAKKVSNGTNSNSERATEKKSNGKSTAGPLNPEECDWETMFDDSGECLDPSLLEQLTSAVGEVTIEKPKSNYNGYKTKSLDMVADEFPHVIEIYNFPPEFQLQDLMTVFSQFKNSGFEIKWVDDTHALGIFSSSAIVSEVLSFYHPFVKTRSLKEGTPLSKMKARRSAEFLLPYKPRPDTCPALARRLVTGALGVRLPTSREEREAEKKILTKAREKKRLEAKQKEDAWEGTFS